MQGDMHQRIGDYEVLGILGAGGMGRVYSVRNVVSDRIEAMKILLPDLAGRKELADRFLREIKLVASLNHPNIATLCTAMEVDNQLVMVMEFVEGTTLTQRLEAGPLPLDEALNYTIQTLSALGYAHAKGIVHRDIKPSNMMLTPSGIVKLMDFGIARIDAEQALTQAGTTLGSIDYMSPEQIMGQPVDARSDLYSVGVSLYEMVTGQRPFRASSDYELMSAHIQQVPKNPIEIQPWLPAELNQVIMKAIAKAPEERFQSADELRLALQTLHGVAAQAAAATAPVLAVPSAPSAAKATATATATAEPAFARVPTAIVSSPPPARPATAIDMPSALPATLVVQKTGFAAHPLLYLGGGVILAAGAIGGPLAYRQHQKAAPVATATAPITVATPAAGAGSAPLSPAGSTIDPPQPPPTVPPAAATAPLPAPSAGPAPAAEAAGHDRPAATDKVATGPRHPANARQATEAAPAPPSAPISATTAAAPEAEDTAKLDALELRIDTLASRASAVNSSLEGMKASMAQSGLGLRTDVATHQASMNNNLQKAQQAMQVPDGVRAERFTRMAEADLKALEAFLGR